MLDKIDKIVSDGLTMLERGAKVSRNHCGFDDVWYIDSGLAQDLTARVELVAKSSMTPEQMIEASKKSKFKAFVGPILKGIAEHGTHPVANPNYIISSESISKEHSSLFPYMVKSFLKESVQLSGFEKPNGRRMWFATTARNESHLTAVGYEGEQINLPLSKLSQLGYSKINGKESQLINVCRDEVGNIDNDDLKKVAFFVSKNAVPGFRISSATEQLKNFLSCIPDMKKDFTPNKNPASSIPKIK
jgi:hypothetical protein